MNPEAGYGRRAHMVRKRCKQPRFPHECVELVPRQSARHWQLRPACVRLALPCQQPLARRVHQNLRRLYACSRPRQLLSKPRRLSMATLRGRCLPQHPTQRSELAGLELDRRQPTVWVWCLLRCHRQTLLVQL